jgi:solute carrier family 25 uncoupling protein 8/9
MRQDQPNPAGRIAREVLAAGAGCLVADALFNPLEVLKVRLQLQPAPPAGARPHYDGLARGLARVAADDGVLRGLWAPGLVATALRAFTYTGCRLGLYPTVRAALLAPGAPADRSTLGARAAAGALTGGLASLVFCPLDVVRVRLQADAGSLDPATGLLRTGLRTGHRPRYASTLGAFGQIATAEGGARALWRGWHLTAARASVLSGTQLAAYDSLKHSGRAQLGLREGPTLHVACAFASGLLAQTAAQPVDTLRSRWMGAAAAYEAAGAAAGRRVLLAAALAGGPRGLFRGYAPAVLRQAPVMLVQMPAVERFRKLAGLEPM